MANLILGDKEFLKILRDLKASDQKRLINGALRHSARTHLVPAVRDAIPDDGPFPGLSQAKRHVKVYTKKGKSPGVYLTMAKNRGIRLTGGQEYTLQGFQGLVIRGSKQRKTKAGRNRGQVSGLGSPYDTASRTKGKTALNDVGNSLSTVMERNIKRLARRGAN